MRHALLAIVFLANWQSAFGAVDPALKLIQQAKYWQSFDWERATSSTLWNAPGWERSDEKTADVVFEKQRTLQLLGLKFSATLNRTIRSDSKTPWLLMLTAHDKTTASTCAELTDWATTKFGPPTAAIDVTTEEQPGGQETRFLNILRETQWTKGQTRLTINCKGVFTGDERAKLVSLVSLSATHLSEMPETIPMFALTCNAQVTFPDGTTGDFMNNTVLYIDEHFGKVRNRQKIAILQDVSIKPDSITFVQEGQPMRLAYNIDRTTGVITVADTNEKQGEYKGKARGTCQKTEVTARKF